MTQQNIENIIQENVQLHTKVSVLEEQLENVQRQLAWLKKQIFGRKTEQASVIMADGIQLSLLNEEISETEDKSENHVAVPAHTRKKRRTHDEWMNALEIKKEFHKVENMVCEKCGAPMKVIGEDLKLSITLDTFPTRIMKQSGRWQPLRRIFAALQQEESRR